MYVVHPPSLQNVPVQTPVEMYPEDEPPCRTSMMYVTIHPMYANNDQDALTYHRASLLRQRSTE